MKMRLGRLVVVCLTTLFVLDVGMRFLPPETYTFRAFEALTLYRGMPGAFEPNQAYFNVRSSGDLAHLANLPSVREFRPEHFTTDRCGNRNPPDILDRGPVDLLLLGSSFTVGSGVDDALVVSERLRILSGLRVYNAGGPPIDEAGWVLTLAKKLEMGRSSRRIVVLEYVERLLVRSSLLPDSRSGPSELDGFCAPLMLWNTKAGRQRLLNTFWTISPLEVHARDVLKRLQNDVFLPNPYRTNAVAATLVNNAPMLFALDEVSAGYATRDVDGPVRLWTELAGRLRANDLTLVVLLVPDKYTVYYPHLEAPVWPEPQGVRYLHDLESRLKGEGVLAINLTEEFMRAARTELLEGRYIYWRDDTHWNGSGIELAARTIVDRLGLR